MSLTSKKDKSASFNHILKYTGIFSIVQVLNMLINIIRNKLAAVFLGPSGIGVMSIYNTSTRLLNESTNFGIPVSAVKHISEIHENGEMQKIRDYAVIVRSYSVLTGLFGMLAGLFGVLLCYIHPDIAFLPKVNDFLNASMIAPIAFFMAVTGGEMAILKGTKQLMAVTKVSILVALVTLVICTPFFYFLGRRGIIWALLVTNICICLVHLHYSTRHLPYRINLRSRSQLKQGIPMLKLGIGFMLAGLFGQGAELIIRTLILNWSSEADVGLYNSGFVMAVTYGSLIFSALDADYFPRLSATGSDVDRQNVTVNRQIEACVLLISPFLIAFVVCMPFIIPLLFSNEFVTCIPMSIGAMLYMYFRAFALPIGYLSLARGDTMMFMITELIYDMMIAFMIPYSYIHWGLLGTGFTLSFCALLDLIMVYSFYRWRYKFRFHTHRLWLYILQFVLLAFTIYIGLTQDGWPRWVIGGTVFTVSLVLSFYILSKETDIISKIKQKFHRS